jgi:antitoxin component YwqK of YwqJK toxin-antitoxin module
MMRVNVSEIEFNDDYSYTYQGEPFTGIAFELGPGGELTSEMTFVGGVKEGPVREWFPSGAKLSERNLHYGALHGVGMEWFETGKPMKRTVHELGVLLESDEWNEEGAVVDAYRLSETDANFKILQRLRLAKWQA